MASSSAFVKAKSFGKRIVGQSEQPVPVVSIKDWTRNLSQNPARDVGSLHLLLLRALSHLDRASRLCDMWSLCSPFSVGLADTVSLWIPLDGNGH